MRGNSIRLLPFGLFLLLLNFHVKAQEVYTFLHDELQREYTIYIPDSLPDKAPLVFLLHGYTGNFLNFMRYSGMNEVADKHKFVVCYPQGTKDRNGIDHWNARLGISNANDIGFLTELAKFLQDRYRLDSQRTFSCGHSNGGFMSYTLACEADDVFKAIASVSGTMSGYTWTNRDISRPISILQIHGIDDTVVPIDGSMAPEGWGGAPHMDSVISYWAKHNECADFDSIFYPNNTHAYYYTEGLNNNEVWYYKIDDWGHSWPGTRNASNIGTIAAEVIWEFFSTVSSNNSGIDEIRLAGPKIYPNPTRYYLNIETGYINDRDYKLYSLSGKLLQYGKVMTGKTVLDLSHLQPGTYLLRIQDQVFRVVKAN